jgi:myo-inositol-1(or 4)-monophosphatase
MPWPWQAPDPLTRTNHSLADDLALAIAAVRAGGAVAAARFGGPLEVREKGDAGPVTDADLAVDALLKDMLVTARPGYGWLSEETVEDGSRHAAQRSWVVDPIDGTRAFVSGKPAWSVCVGLIEGAEAVAGAVFNPVTDECFWAVRGQGAFRNGEPIGASATGDIENCRMLGDAQMFRHPAWPTPWPAMRVETRNSIAYRMCLVASGDFDAAIALSAKSDWDVAAATVIAEEAGALAGNHLGQRYAFNGTLPRQSSMVVAGRALHPLLIGRVSHVVLP